MEPKIVEQGEMIFVLIVSLLVVTVRAIAQRRTRVQEEQ